MMKTFSYNEKDIQKNRDEIIDVFYSMIDENANTNYSLYPIYKESFEKFVHEIMETNKVLQYQHESIHDYHYSYIEEDKHLIIKQKSKCKQKSIIELFEKI